MYNNTISGTATEKGNDDIITDKTISTIILSLAQQLKKEVMII